jgi:hypothetical protein
MGLGLMLIALVLAGWSARAHEIPTDVRVQIHLEAQDERFTALMRVPLAAMRDFDFATRGPGYLDLAKVQPQLEAAAELWLVNDFRLYENGERVAEPAIARVRVALPSDRSFVDFDTALSAITHGALPVETNLYWEQALLDVAVEFRIRSDTAEFELEPTFARLGQRTMTQVRFSRRGGEPRGFSFVGDPGRISLDPRPLSVFGQFIIGGFEHVLDGKDHLLFLLALVIPIMVIRPLVVVVTAFTLAHSITLAASMLDLVPAGLWFPAFVELAIAASIFYMALENLLKPSLSRRWLVAFAFGLIHGFGFSFALRDTLQFAGDHILVSLLGFNLGIELGQILVLLAIVPLLKLATRWVPQKGLTLVLSALIAHSAWHWLTERWVVLTAYSWSLPEPGIALLLDAMRWMILILVAALVVWLLKDPFERWSGPVESKDTLH